MKASTILGIDYGDRAIGLAIARAGEPPVPLITLANSQSIFAELKDLIDAHSIDQLVIGWPRNLDGESTHQTLKAEHFAQQLKQHGWLVVLQDEAVTSELAQARLPRKLSLREAKNLTHQYAAVIILEDYLAGQA